MISLYILLMRKHGPIFDSIHYFDKVVEAHNVRVALATHGFNPYGTMAASYCCWHVFFIHINLPLGIIVQ
jgi:hypothetical protein